MVVLFLAMVKKLSFCFLFYFLTSFGARGFSIGFLIPSSLEALSKSI
jgi:hypothetical protein